MYSDLEGPSRKTKELKGLPSSQGKSLVLGQGSLARNQAGNKRIQAALRKGPQILLAKPVQRSPRSLA